MRVGRIALSDERKSELISRRRALVLLGLSGAVGLAVPSLLPTAAEAQAIPPAFDQVDKPVPGEGGAAQTSPQLDKPIPSEQTGTKTRRHRRRPARERRVYRRGRRSTQRQPRQPGSP